MLPYRWIALILIAGADRALAQQPAMPTPKVVAKLPQTAADGWLIVSPDGKVVLMSGDKALYRIDRATGAFTKVADGEFSDARWSRDNRLTFDRADESNDDYIWSAPIDPATGKLTAAPRRVSLGAGDTPVASPDGKSIAFAKDTDAGQVVALIPANGGPERILARGTGGGVNPFAWSADGQWIYYDVASGPDRSSPFIACRPAVRTRCLSRRAMVRRRCRRTANTSSTICRATRPPSLPRTVAYFGAIRIADAVSGSLAHTPRWLPGSDAVLFTTTRRAAAVTAVSLGDGRSRVLGDSTARSVFPAVSPDGKSVAALSSVGGRLQVTIRPIAGGAARAIRTLDIPFEYPLTWSPDSRFIAVHTGRIEHPGRPAAMGLEVVDVAGGKSQRVVTAARRASPALERRRPCDPIRASGGRVRRHTNADGDSRDGRSVAPTNSCAPSMPTEESCLPATNRSISSPRDKSSTSRPAPTSNCCRWTLCRSRSRETAPDPYPSFLPTSNGSLGRPPQLERVR